MISLSLVRLITIAAVSSTHLDVYKRQIKEHLIKAQNIKVDDNDLMETAKEAARAQFAQYLSLIHICKNTKNKGNIAYKIKNYS